MKDYKSKQRKANQHYNINIDTLERIWNSVFYEGIKIDPLKSPLFLVQSAFLDDNFNKKLIEIIFELFNFPKMYSTISNVTGILAEGRTTGISLDSGYLGTTCLRVFEGFPEKKTMSISPYGGSFFSKKISNI